MKAQAKDRRGITSSHGFVSQCWEISVAGYVSRVNSRKDPAFLQEEQAWATCYAGTKLQLQYCSLFTDNRSFSDGKARLYNTWTLKLARTIHNSCVALMSIREHRKVVLLCYPSKGITGHEIYFLLCMDKINFAAKNVHCCGRELEQRAGGAHPCCLCGLMCPEINSSD